MGVSGFTIDRLVIRALAGVCLLAPLAARAATTSPAIGAAAVVRNDVRGETPSRRAALIAGEKVIQNERVSTGADSMTRIVLVDDTNVALGPSSQLTLDRFVFDPDAGARAVGIEAAKGVFRFFSGRAAHEAYDIKTPQASIAVRGTTYDVLAEAGRTRVTLRDGAVHVCMRTAPRCVDLTEPGQSVEVTDQSIDGPLPASGGVNFDRFCGGRDGAALCGRARFAALASGMKPRAALSLPARQRPTRLALAPPRERLHRVFKHRPIWRDDPDDEPALMAPPPFIMPGFPSPARWGRARWGDGSRIVVRAPGASGWPARGRIFSR